MDKLLGLFKILSDETRLRIAVLLVQGELCVCQISGVLDISQPKVSKHLSKLRDLGFVTDDRQERYVYYQLKDNPLFIKILNHILENLDQYPQLAADQHNLADKDKYLSQCIC